MLTGNKHFLEWTDLEVTLVKKHFGELIKQEKYPSTSDIKKFIEQYKWTRDPKVIKAKLQHLIKTK